MRERGSNHDRAFSLVELVIVIVILGVIGAIAVPRITQGIANAGVNALQRDLQIIRNAIETYAAEHEGKLPTSAAQLVSLTDAAGNLDDGTGAAGGYIFGPYLAAAPALPVGSKKGSRAMEVVHDAFATPPGSTNAGWWYNAATGEVRANLPTTARALSGQAFNRF